MKRMALAVFSLACAACEDPVNTGGGGESGELQLRITAVGFGEDAGLLGGVNRNRARTADVGYTTTFVNGDEIGITVVQGSILQDNIPHTFNGSAWVSGGATIRAVSGATYLVYYPYSSGMNGITSEAEIITMFTPLDDQRNHDTQYAKADLMTGTGTVDSTGTTLSAPLAHKMALVEVSLPSGASPREFIIDGTNVTGKMYVQDGVYRYIVKPLQRAALSGEYVLMIDLARGDSLTFEWRHSPSLTEGEYARVSIEPPAGIRRIIGLSTIDVPFRYVPSGSYQRDGTSVLS